MKYARKLGSYCTLSKTTSPFAHRKAGKNPDRCGGQYQTGAELAAPGLRLFIVGN